MPGRAAAHAGMAGHGSRCAQCHERLQYADCNDCNAHLVAAMLLHMAAGAFHAPFAVAFSMPRHAILPRHAGGAHHAAGGQRTGTHEVRARG